MNTNLGSDDFYVLNPKSGDHFSVAGLQFMGEMIDQAVRSIGWDPTKVCIGLNYTHVWIGYPSAATKVVTDLHVKEGKLHYRPRLAEPRVYNGKQYKGYPQMAHLPLAEPELIKNFGVILAANLPKTSKFYGSVKPD